MLDADRMAEIHAAAFTRDRPWSRDEFVDLLAGPGCFAVSEAAGFALGRVVADEAELLTIAVLPECQGDGLGGALLSRFELEARSKGAATAFLEVAADNPAALALYRGTGWRESGRRPGYYHRQHGPAADAVLMRKELTPG